MDPWVVTFLFLIGVWFYFWVKKKHSYFEDKGIPYIRPVFFLGSTYHLWLGTRSMGDLYLEHYRRANGARLAGFFQFLKPGYIVTDPGLVRRVLVEDFSSFHSRGCSVDEKTDPLDGNLFHMDGEKWRVLRKKLSPTFTSGKIKWMFQQMNVCGDSLMTALAQKISSSQEVEVRDLMSRFTIDVIGSCAFGFEPEALKDQNSHFREMCKRAFGNPVRRMITTLLRKISPRIHKRLKLRTIPKEVNDFFFSIVDQAFQHRLKTGEKRNDFLQLLLELREKGSIDFDAKDVPEEYEVGDLLEVAEVSEKLELTDALLTAQAFVFFTAGFETTATTINFFLQQLAKYPECQKKLREEIRRVREKHEGRLDYDALKDIPYLDACISETLRLKPPAEVFFRTCTRDTFLDGVLIKESDVLVLPVGAIQTDPRHFESPLEFRPERFLRGSPTPGTYAPFGDGPRSCIARRFALVQIKLAVARILDSYMLSLSPRTTESLKTAPGGSSTRPKGGVWLRFETIPTLDSIH